MSDARNGTIPVEPFQERYYQLRAQGYTAGELAVWAGYMGRGRGDPSRLLRALGLKAESGHGTFTHHVKYETAVRLADAFGMAPHEAGF